MIKLSLLAFTSLMIFCFLGCKGGGAELINSPGTSVTVTGAISSISTSDTTTCAVRGGYVKCWGNNSYGQLGNGSTTSSLTPVLVSGLANITKVDTNGVKTCALTSTGSLYCWGRYDYSTDQLSPTLVSGLNGISDFSVGRNNQVCAIRSSLVYCWGLAGTYLPVGASTTGYNNTPTLVSGLTNVDRVEAGFDVNCVRSSNKLKCWGTNSSGVFGNNSTTGSSATPVDLSSYFYWTVDTISNDLHTLCTLHTSHTIFCAGSNNSGQIYSQPNTSLTSPITTPSYPYQSPNATLMASGDRHTCAVTASNVIKCWGNNCDGQLGINSIGCLVHQPTTVSNITTNVIAITAGQDTTCAAFSDESAYCWGSNSNGQVGNGTTTDQMAPVKVQGL